MLAANQKHLSQQPNTNGQTSEGRTAIRSRAHLLGVWRRALTNTHSASDPTDAVVEEMAEYFSLTKEEVIQRCRDWENDSVKEWQAGDRSTPEGLLDFYQTQTSWIFDTMWYHAEQAHEHKPTESVDIAQGLAEMRPDLISGRHLDYGAGPGSSSLFFHLLGWDVSLADISTPFLNFAKWRLQRHGVPAVFYDLTRETLPKEAFDLITAFDVMVHVPDILGTLLAQQHALKPGGYLIFNIDNQPCTEKTASHLYADQYPILRHVRAAGFRRCPKISYFHVYQKVGRSRSQTLLIRLADLLRYNVLVTRLGNIIRRLRQSAH